jgi:hypothetical protein
MLGSHSMMLQPAVAHDSRFYFVHCTGNDSYPQMRGPVSFSDDFASMTITFPSLCYDTTLTLTRNIVANV